MKKIILFTFVLISSAALSQTLDSVVLGTSYINESYYSFENGEVLNVNNSNWDLAFDLSTYGATIRMNRRTDVLYLYPGPIADWATLDTAGHSVWTKYIDGYESWEQGALNAPLIITDPTDLGWGLYNTLTHVIAGNRLFVIKLQDGSYRKLLIEDLTTGTYSFKYSHIDGSNEINETIIKSDYANQNFIHYSILNEAAVDREPESADWDIVFTNYVLELAPGYFSGVTGALSNSTYNAVSVSESNDVPVNDAEMNANPFVPEINTIGYDWKTFDMGTFSYVIDDSLCYFVKDELDNVWKLVFTGFAGGATGKIYFTKEQIAFSEVLTEEESSISIFPVPAPNQLTIRSAEISPSTIIIYNAAGQIISSENYASETGDITIAVENFENGIYLVQIITTENQIINKKISVQH